MRTEAIGPLGQQALKELEPRLAAIGDDAAKRPHADPYAAATTALLVSDFLTKGGNAGAAELGTVARAIVALVTQLGGEYLSDAKSVPGDLFQRAMGVRNNAVTEIGNALPDNGEVKTWLEAIRLGSGVVDLVYDLRTLIDLHSRHTLPESLAKLPATLKSNADAVEFALRAGEAPEHAKSRTTLAKLWTLFVPAYEKALAAAPPDRKFPTLALIAGHKRSRRKPAGLLGATSAPRAVPKPQGPQQMPPLPMPPVPQSKPVEITEAEIVKSDPPPPITPVMAPSPAAESKSFAESRREPRHFVELEVNIGSESNFYLGFTENLSSGGVFIATYSLKAIGSKVEIALTLPDGAVLTMPGVVRWLRQPSGEGWPGIGVQFEKVSAEDEARIRKFLSLREPMFYDA